MLLAVEYFDELIYLIRNLHLYKEKEYKENYKLFSAERYGELRSKVDFLLTSSRLHARVALTYGENSEEIKIFNQLRFKLINVIALIFTANPETWDEVSKKVTNLFEKEIDPVRQNTEMALIRSTRLKAILRSIVSIEKR